MPAASTDHNRTPTPIDDQTVIRMTRDTLYSAAVVGLSEGATVTILDCGGRYVSAMVVNQDHDVNRVLHEPGDHELTLAEHETPWVAVAVRILVDPSDRDDGAAVNALQDGVAVEARSPRPTTTRPASTPRGRRCSSSPGAFAGSTARSARGARSTRSVT